MRPHPVIVLLLVFGFFVVMRWDNREAKAAAIPVAMVAEAAHVGVQLANPLKTGRNTRIHVGAVPKRVNAYGNNCAITLYNNMPVPVFTGYGNAYNDGGFDTRDGGVSTRTGIPICNTTACISTWVTRDTVPDKIWMMTASPPPAPADGGVWVVEEAAGGCNNP